MRSEKGSTERQQTAYIKEPRRLLNAHLENHSDNSRESGLHTKQSYFQTSVIIIQMYILLSDSNTVARLLG